jgi:ATP synthase protein I
MGGSNRTGFHVYYEAVLNVPVTDMTAAGARHDRYDDELEDPPARPLTRDEAQALRARHPSVSPWWVIAVQIAIGGVAAALVWVISPQAVWSALYGAATAVVPGALMARGMTSRLSSVSPGASAVSVMYWSLVKIGVSVLMLLLAPRVLQSVNWPALLAALVLCMQVYWFALLRRGR